MSVTQTVDIPVSHRLTIDVPGEVPAGKAIITFTPVADSAEDGLYPDSECPICAAKNYMPNAKTIAAIEEGDAMLRGEIPAKWCDSLEELLKELRS